MKVIKSAEFEDTIKSGVTLVDFFADWCGPCKMLAPVLEDVSLQYPDIEFVKVNVDENMDLAERFGIMSIPTVYLFKDGEVIGKTGGYQDPTGICRFIDDSLKA
jgi:thioredoxin 1